MKKLTQDEMHLLIESMPSKIGLFCHEFGYIGSDDTEEVIIEGRSGHFLAPLSEFIRDGILIRPTPTCILAIGGFPESEAEKLSREMSVSRICAADIIYLRTRSRWSQELESKLIQMHAENKRPNMNEFGCSKKGMEDVLDLTKATS